MALKETTLGDLIDRERLPSGHSFKLKPDTVANALAVGEAQDNRPWREQLLQCLAMVESVGGKDIAEAGGINFLANMPDTDIVFLRMAWFAEANGRKMELGDGGVPCPECQTPFSEISLGPIKIFAVDSPVSGPDGLFKLELELSERHLKMLPESMRDATFFIRAPTWKAARQNVSARTMEKPEMVMVYRAAASMMYQPKSGNPAPVPFSMVKEFPQVIIRQITKAMDQNIPYMAREIRIVCKTCGAELDVPFDQAVSST